MTDPLIYSDSHNYRPDHETNKQTIASFYFPWMTVMFDSQHPSSSWRFARHGRIIRTHRVALSDWLQEPICILQFKFNIFTSRSNKNQFADILNSSNFTCNEWKHFLYSTSWFSRCFPGVILVHYKAEHHVEESSWKKDRRRACDDNIKVSILESMKWARTVSHDGNRYITESW